ERLADAEDRHQARVARRLVLLDHDRIRVAEKRAALGVADDRVARAEFGDHPAGNLPGVRALVVAAAILAAPPDRRAPQDPPHLGQIRIRHAHRARRRPTFRDFPQESPEQSLVRGEASVELPVADHGFRPHRDPQNHRILTRGSGPGLRRGDGYATARVTEPRTAAAMASARTWTCA